MAFKLKSGNSTSFKSMGSSPVKQTAAQNLTNLANANKIQIQAGAKNVAAPKPNSRTGKPTADVKYKGPDGTGTATAVQDTQGTLSAQDPKKHTTITSKDETTTQHTKNKAGKTKSKVTTLDDTKYGDKLKKVDKKTGKRTTKPTTYMHKQRTKRSGKVVDKHKMISTKRADRMRKRSNRKGDSYTVDDIVHNTSLKQRRNKKKNKETEVDYSLPYSGTEGKSSSRTVADKKYDSQVTPEERQLGSKLTLDTEGNYTRRTKLSSPALPQRKVYSSGAPINPDYPHAVRSKKTTGPDDGPHPDRISNKNNPEEFKGAIKEMDKFLNPKNPLDHIFNK